MTQSTMCLTALPESIYVYSMCVHGSVCVCVFIATVVSCSKQTDLLFYSPPSLNLTTGVCDWTCSHFSPQMLSLHGHIIMT